MISAEAPVLFAKAAEIFINELTLRGWVHAEDNKRRTLQVWMSARFLLLEYTVNDLVWVKIYNVSEVLIDSLLNSINVMLSSTITLVGYAEHMYVYAKVAFYVYYKIIFLKIYLQRNDIAMAITKYDQFDFLIDIVPREEIRPTKRVCNFKSSAFPVM